jgi:hypothetical protein
MIMEKDTKLNNFFKNTIRELLNENANVVGLDYTDDEEGLYSDEYVSGQIRIVGNDVEILDWNSKYSTNRGTEISLKRLKDNYGGEIRAVDAGYPHEESFKYWKKMMMKGLVDGVYDDDANLHQI